MKHIVILVLLIFCSTPMVSQRGQRLELLSVKNNVFHFQMGNVSVTATCIRAHTEIDEGKKIDAECGGVMPDLGKSVAYCDSGSIAARDARGEEIADRCYEATTGQLELMLWFKITGSKGVRIIMYEQYHVVTMQKSKGTIR